MFYEDNRGFQSEIFQVMNYYPKYSYLDDIISVSGKKTLNIYIDLKGCLQTLYQKWAIEYLLTRSRSENVIDTTVFLSVVEFIAWHKIYAKKRDINIKFFFFFESGKSSYHLNIHSDYKKNRSVADFFGLDDASRDLFFKILDKNYHVIEKICSRIPDVSIIRLKFLEADFVPYYLINRVLTNADDSAHVIYSMDKDMLQCLNKSNIFQFYRHYKQVKTITSKDIFSHFLKTNEEFEPEWFELVLAIIGDVSDDFKGVPGVGAISLLKVLKQVISLCGSMEKVYLAIKNKQSIFDKSPIYNVNSKTILGKIINSEDIIIRNLKLLSFRILSDELDGGFPTYMNEQKKIILDNVNNQNKIPNASVLLNALEKSGMQHVSEQSIVNLF
jgi:hypothetical protein